MDMREFLRVLGLNPLASVEQIKKAYKSRCKETHPDLGGDAEEFKRVQHAYKMLTDPKYRYESEPKAQKRRYQDLELRLNIQVSFDDAFFGRKFKINYNRPNKNPKAKIEILELEIDVNPGSQATREFTQPGYGYRDGDMVGDAVVTLRFESSPKFSIQGMDVRYELPVPLKTLLSGGEMSVETMWGLQTIQVPSMSVPGDVIIIPSFGVERQGHQMVILGLVYPKKEEFKKDEYWQDALDVEID